MILTLMRLKLKGIHTRKSKRKRINVTVYEQDHDFRNIIWIFLLPSIINLVYLVQENFSQNYIKPFICYASSPVLYAQYPNGEEELAAS